MEMPHAKIGSATLNLADLRRTLDRALGSGRVGIPVALRVHLRLERIAGANIDLESAAASLLSWGEEVFGSPPQRVAVSENEGHSLTVLATCAGGQTLHVTVAASGRPDLHLLLIGNHGIVRLEGGELLEAFGAIEPASTEEIEETEASDGQQRRAGRIRTSRDAGGVLTTGTTGAVP
jgi:hypothetical protein